MLFQRTVKNLSLFTGSALPSWIAVQAGPAIEAAPATAAGYRHLHAYQTVSTLNTIPAAIKSTAWADW
jgi:hypothetical protein